MLEITRKNLGMTAIVDAERKVRGVFTDGDLRRTLNQGHDIQHVRIEQVMTRNCRTIRPEMLAAEAVKLMEDHRITALPVTDADNRLIGALNMQDLLRAGVV